MSLLLSLGLIHQLMNVYCLPEGFCLAGLALCLDPVCLDEGKVEGLTLGFGVSKALSQTPGHKPHSKVSQPLGLAVERQLCGRLTGSSACVPACAGPGWVSPWTYTLVPDW